ncbi:MAG: gliding motility-associated C-terminal domain-containing protein [Saprospiraceae bacterium]|nr:gliding motility-associated C-terminal domain-containing protein [Saprospiraceae bacterium]
MVSIKDSLINGYHVLCNGDATAGLSAETSGGTGQYSYKWTSGSQRITISGLAAGTQTLQVTDDNGCITSASATITQPDKLVISNLVTPPDCSGINSGSIDILQSAGGVGSYTYLLNDKPAVFPVKNLGTGIYMTQILDENGCGFQLTDTLQSLEIPVLSGDSVYQLALGDSIELTIFSDVDAANVVWSPVTDILNPDALETKARPVQSRVYVVSVTSDDGCVRTYEVSVNVEKRRSFVIANGLTSKEGVNATLRYFAGPDVSSLVNYRVYDRWGSKVFETTNLPAGVIDIPWDRTFNGRSVMGGVYAWTAEVTYIDGETVTYTGALHIID